MVGAPNSVNFTAGNVAILSNADLTGAMNISMASQTLELSNVNFPAGSTVNLRAQTGMLAPNPNTSQAVVPGHVNFIQNVDYNGSPAELQVPVGQGGAGPGNNINITTFP